MYVYTMYYMPFLFTPHLFRTSVHTHHVVCTLVPFEHTIPPFARIYLFQHIGDVCDITPPPPLSTDSRTAPV